MEAVSRVAWTDERLDDLNGRVDDLGRRMDAGFARVDGELRLVRTEIASLRLETTERFERMEGGFNSRFDSLQRTMIQTTAALAAGMLAGFGGLAGLIATQM